MGKYVVIARIFRGLTSTAQKECIQEILDIFQGTDRIDVMRTALGEMHPAQRKLVIEQYAPSPQIDTHKEILSKQVPSVTPSEDTKMRPYHPNGEIKNLFNKYHNTNKTKRSTFLKISKELSISEKAVKKAYYKK